MALCERASKVWQGSAGLLTQPGATGVRGVRRGAQSVAWAVSDLAELAGECSPFPQRFIPQNYLGVGQSLQQHAVPMGRSALLWLSWFPVEDKS